MTTALILAALLADPWGDGSPAVQYGPGAGYGQAYYPDNILGPPDPDATPSVPAVGEDELLTLGKDGWVVIEFTDNTVIDGVGVDFTVFENVMYTGSGYFRECAFVEVSQDGVNWTMFPWNGETFEGLAGVWPTTGDDPTDPQVSGGDQFDLADIDMDWIRFIRLTDCGDSVADGGLCDIDAVAAVNSTTGIEGAVPEAVPLKVSSPFSSSFTVTAGCPGTLLCHSMDGRLRGSWEVAEGTQTVFTGDVPAGVLFFSMNGNRCSAVRILRER